MEKTESSSNLESPIESSPTTKNSSMPASQPLQDSLPRTQENEKPTLATASQPVLQQSKPHPPALPNLPWEDQVMLDQLKSWLRNRLNREPTISLLKDGKFFADYFDHKAPARKFIGDSEYAALLNLAQWLNERPPEDLPYVEPDPA